MHDRLKGIAASGSEYVFAGRRLTEIAEMAKGRPFYAYDRHAITQRVEDIRSALPDYIRLHYAVKANPMPALVAHVADLVDGLDVASDAEIEIAVNAGCLPQHISIAGPGKSDADLSKAVATGITVNVESAAEIRRLAAVASETGIRPAVAVRVNPDFELRASGMKMSGGPRQFGIDEELVPDVLSLISGLELAFKGFHIFCGSQNLSSELICEAQNRVVELAIRLSQYAPDEVTQLNIGGGFGIPYFPGEKPLDLEPIGNNLAKLEQGIHAAMPRARVILELGRYIVGEAGIYVCRVIERKHSRGSVFLVTNGGMHHHLAASGNLGQVLRKNYPVFVGTKMESRDTEVASVVGPLCTPLDMLAERIELSRAEAGDLVVVLQSGAYGLTASPIAFLGHPPPAELLL